MKILGIGGAKSKSPGRDSPPPKGRDSQAKAPGRAPASVVPRQTAAPAQKAEEWSLFKKGFAKKGVLIAALKSATPGKEGKNIHGEAVPPPKINEPKLLAGSNVRFDKGNTYYMNVDGIVEVFQDRKGNYQISGKPFKPGSSCVTLSEDGMEAFLAVAPSLGGADPVTIEQVVAQCEARGVSVPLDETAVTQTIAEAERDKREIDGVVIARGEPPVDGKDGTIEFKVKLSSGNRFTALKDGRVDFKEHDLYTSVEKGQLLAVVTRGEPGVKNGRTASGKVIEAKEGKSTELRTGHNISVEDREGSLHFYSLIDGRLFTDKGGISVEPLMVIEGNVGPETGNLDFNGAITIKGEISDGFRVTAKKDVTIFGNVGNARVTSEGNILIVGGIIGKTNGFVSAKGNVIAKFAESAIIEAGGSVVIHRAALNCRIRAGDRIVATREKGHLIGGELKAKNGIDAKVLGNESEQRTDVYVGSDFFVEKNLEGVRESLRKHDAVAKKLTLLLEKLARANHDPERLPEKLKTSYIEATRRKALILLAMDKLRKTEAEHLAQLEELADAQVVAHEVLHPGVRLFFGKHLYEPDARKTKARVFFDKTTERIKVAAAASSRG